MRVAIQMDHIAGINITGDTSFALLLEAQQRGYELYHYTPDKLTLSGKNLFVQASSLEVNDVVGAHYKLGMEQNLELASMNVVLLRQDPPFNMNYITTTHLLEHLPKQTRVLNDPFWVRNSPEKLFVLQFSEFMPQTIITSDVKQVEEFRKAHKAIIIKPLYGNGGAGVFYLDSQDKNLHSLIELFASCYNEPFIVQEYLPAIEQGDKRIILIDGEPVGAITRVAAHGEVRSNLHVGGQAHPSTITEAERAICDQIAPWLQERGLFLTGIDIIGDKITEINVTSPTGIREIKRFSGIDIAKIFWDKAEKHLANIDCNA